MPGYNVSFPGGSAAIAQYAFVKTPAAVVVTAAATDGALGVVQDSVDANATQVNVRVHGETRVIASAAIAKGAALMLAAGGKVATHDGTSTKPVVGLAAQAATADGDEILAFIGSHAFLAGPAA